MVVRDDDLAEPVTAAQTPERVVDLGPGRYRVDDRRNAVLIDEIRHRFIHLAGSRLDAVHGDVLRVELIGIDLRGPAGGGGAFKSTREVIAVQSVLLPRAAVTPSFSFVEA